MQFFSDESKSTGTMNYINYSGHYSSIGWLDTISNGASYDNNTASNYYLQTIKVEISGFVSQYYDIYYTTNVRNIGLMGWAKAGEKSGTENYYLPIEGIQVKLVRKEESEPSHLNNLPYNFFYGTDPSRVVQGDNGETVINTYRDSEDYAYQYIELGVTGQSKPLYGLKLSLRISEDTAEHIQYRAHFSHTGWSNWSDGDNLLRTQYRMQAVSIKLTDDLAEYFDIYYATHVSHIGWMNWAKNGGNAGTTGYGNDYPIESLRILIVKKGITPQQLGLNDHANSNAFLQK